MLAMNHNPLYKNKQTKKNRNDNKSPHSHSNKLPCLM